MIYEWTVREDEYHLVVVLPNIEPPLYKKAGASNLNPISLPCFVR